MKQDEFGNSDPYICIIGCAVIDIAGFPNGPLVQRDANQGRLQISMGGVGRNIAENLARLGCITELITILADDVFSDRIKEHSGQLGIGLLQSLQLKDKNSAVHMAVMDENNDLAVAVSAMTLFDNMTVEFMESKMDFISASEILVVDTSMPTEVIEHILRSSHYTKIFVEVDAAVKADRILNVLDCIYFLKLNRIEAEILTKKSVKTKAEIQEAARFFLDKGVQNICISMGEEGLYLANNQSNILANPPPAQVVNVNGAGDALASGFIYGCYKGHTVEQSIPYAQACAALTLEHQDTVSDQISEESLLNFIDAI